MCHRILWIEDDYFAIKGLMRPLQKMGFDIIIATSAVDAVRKLERWQEYSVIVVDLILPLNSEPDPLPDELKLLGNEEFVGVALLKWLHRNDVSVPVVLISVVRDPIERFNLQRFRIDQVLLKRGLLPDILTGAILNLVETNADPA